jgi:hypothetical protein
MKKAFSKYTNEELLTLTNEQLNDAIRIEAIERGIQPPITLSEALRRSEFVGYQLPAEAVSVFEICTQNDGYSSVSPTGVAYFSEEKAKAALDGLVTVDENRYGKGGPRIVANATITIQRRYIGLSAAESKASKLEQFFQDNEGFNKLSDECLEKLSSVRQADYDKRVNSEKKAEYLRLSGGDDQIARGFWAKVEAVQWPD